MSCTKVCFRSAEWHVVQTSFQVKKSTQQQLNDCLHLSVPDLKKAQNCWLDPLKTSTALWMPARDHKQPPTLPKRRGQKSEDIPDFLGTFRFATPTSCSGMFAFLSSQTSGSEKHTDCTLCLHLKKRLFNMRWCAKRPTTNVWQLMSFTLPQTQSGWAARRRNREHYVFWQTAMFSFSLHSTFLIRGNRDPPHILTHL